MLLIATYASLHQMFRILIKQIELKYSRKLRPPFLTSYIDGVEANKVNQQQWQDEKEGEELVPEAY